MTHQNSEKPLEPVTFRFPLADVTGKFLRDPSLWGSLGFREYYEGTFSETEPLIQAIRAVHRGERVAEDHLRTLRSFSLAWLTSSQKGLSAVIDYAVPLADSVQYITRIGLIDRTVNKLTVATAGIATSILFLEMAWESAAVDFSEMSDLESASFMIDQMEMSAELDSRLDKIVRALDGQLGQVGEPTQRAAFRPDIVFDFLKLSRFRSVLAHADFDAQVHARLVSKLDARIFALFLANSRQIEGLTLCGASEATAAVVAHAALALGLLSNSDSAETLKQIEKRIMLLDDSARQTEAQQTFDAIGRNLTGKAHQLELSINRHLNSATATEAIDWATFPITSSFDLLGTIAEGLGQFAGTSKVGGFLKIAGDSFNQISSLADATPDAASHIINSGVSAEQWARNLVGKLWKK